MTEKPFQNGNIVFNNISYSYNNYEDVIKNLSLSIQENTHYLAVMPNTINKSIFNALCAYR